MAEVDVVCPHCGNEKWHYEWDDRQQKHTVYSRPIIYGTTRAHKKVRVWSCCKGPA